jgi:oligopeptide transport system ATP-binding protein
MVVGAGWDLPHRAMTPLLEVQNLHVSYSTRTGLKTPALARVSFALESGETLGVLGESGSGKSTLAAAMLRILPAGGQIEKGAVRFAGEDLLQLPARELEKIRGGRIAMVFQEPSMALHPALRAGDQVSNVIAAHQTAGRHAARENAEEILSAVFASDAGRIFDSYPHQLSGGQRARVLIAQAIACRPSLIVADEPTASLDPETQLEIVALFRKLRQQLNLSLIWITHNPALLERFADRVLVLYAGRVVEVGPAKEVLEAPRHPYTKALLRSLPPRLGEGFAAHKGKLSAILGEVPASVHSYGGCCCSFEPRCAERMDLCREREPEMVQLSSSRESLCLKHVG